MKPDLSPRELRRAFAKEMLIGLRVISPILSGLLVVIVALGLVVGQIEGWKITESVYFAFVSGLTIGYGDLAPKTLVSRVLAIIIGICGVLATALVAAVAVKAFVKSEERDDKGDA
jgi:hypothetical protein